MSVKAHPTLHCPFLHLITFTSWNDAQVAKSHEYGHEKETEEQKDASYHSRSCPLANVSLQKTSNNCRQASEREAQAVDNGETGINSRKGGVVRSWFAL